MHSLNFIGIEKARRRTVDNPCERHKPCFLAQKRVLTDAPDGRGSADSRAK